MMRHLRKRHLQIWTALAFLLPIGIIAAWLSVPRTAVSRVMQPAQSNALPVVLRSLTKNDYELYLRANDDTTQLQLEWIAKNSISSPSVLIYKAAAVATGNATLIGRVDAKGTYHFNLDSSFSINDRYLLYDIIHKKVIDSVNF